MKRTADCSFWSRAGRRMVDLDAGAWVLVASLVACSPSRVPAPPSPQASEPSRWARLDREYHREVGEFNRRTGARRHFVEKSIHSTQRPEVGCVLVRRECNALGLRNPRAQGLELDQELAALCHHVFQVRDVDEIAEGSLGRAKGGETPGALREFPGRERTGARLHGSP